MAATKQQEKVSKDRAEYRPHPHGAQRCQKCTMFRAPMSCTAVEGKISSGGWCKYYEAK